MNELYILLCGSRKIWDTDRAASGPYPASQAYTGTLHKKCRAYAERFGGDWVALSAKHGFLLPDDEVPANYDVAFGKRHPETITPEELAAQVKAKRLDGYDRVIVLGGNKFKSVVPGAFTQPTDICFPLSGTKGIGHMLQLLDRAAASGEPLPSIPPPSDETD